MIVVYHQTRKCSSLSLPEHVTLRRDDGDAGCKMLDP